MVVLCAVILSFPFVYAFVYSPLKFRHVIAQIESAKTPAEERQAFRLARQYRPFDKIILPRRSDGVIVGEGLGFIIVFKQIRPFSNEHYSAKRTLLAETNLLYLESSVMRPVEF
jgi:hypothetical protein